MRLFDKFERRIRGMVRRMSVTATSLFTRWQVSGYENERAADLELFPGVGFYSRPVSGAGECIVLKVGGSHQHEVIVATRDAGTQVDLDEDETAVFNSTGAIVRITKDGDIALEPAAGREILARSPGGTAEALATKSDVEDAKTTFDSHTHPDPASGFTGSPADSGGPITMPSPSGTSTLKGE